jgi:hypothetical protein
MLLMILITIWFLIANKFNFVAFLMCFIWGFCDGGVNTHTLEMLGFEFETNVEPYSVMNLLQAIGAVICLLIQAQLSSKKAFIIYTIIVGIIGFVTCGTTYFFPFSGKHYR